MELLTVFGGEPILTLFPFEIDFLSGKSHKCLYAEYSLLVNFILFKKFFICLFLLNLLFALVSRVPCGCTLGRTVTNAFSRIARMFLLAPMFLGIPYSFKNFKYSSNLCFKSFLNLCILRFPFGVLGARLLFTRFGVWGPLLKPTDTLVVRLVFVRGNLRAGAKLPVVGKYSLRCVLILYTIRK